MGEQAKGGQPLGFASKKLYTVVSGADRNLGQVLLLCASTLAVHAAVWPDTCALTLSNIPQEDD